MDITIILIFSIAALVSSFGTLVGLGGGVFMVPLLILVFKIPIAQAIGSASLALFPAALISTIFNAKRGLIDYRAGIGMEIPTILGAVIGAMLTSILPIAPLEALFSFFIFYTGLKILGILKKESPSSQDGFLVRINSFGPQLVTKDYTVGYLVLVLAGLFSGTIAGLFGIGGGVVKTPIMLKLFKMPARIATSTALFMIMFTGLSSAITHYRLGNVSLVHSTPVVLGFLIGPLVANMIAPQISNKSIEKLIGTALLLASIVLIGRKFF
jgi:hypothetical protein